MEQRQKVPQIHRQRLHGALIMTIELDYELTFSVGQRTVSDFYPNDRADLNRTHVPSHKRALDPCTERKPLRYPLSLGLISTLPFG